MWTLALQPPGQKIAIARDEAFSFLYPHMLRGWRAAGAELTFFSPLADEAPPQDCEVCWLPGGYPELHAETLANACNFATGLKRFADTGAWGYGQFNYDAAADAFTPEGTGAGCGSVDTKPLP